MDATLFVSVVGLGTVGCGFLKEHWLYFACLIVQGKYEARKCSVRDRQRDMEPACMSSEEACRFSLSTFCTKGALHLFPDSFLVLRMCTEFGSDW
mmetsp:Transcript_10307/g.20773  ORF Transcript_10307/g.20773 Transcript_10307/m.20773 type:complete len:95 (+) Transcript_10307:1554-1838(+)